MPPMCRLPRCATTTPATSTARREWSPSAVSPRASTHDANRGRGRVQPGRPAAVEHGVDATVVEMVSQPATEETGVVELVAFDAAATRSGTSATPLSESAGASVPSATTVKATLSRSGRAHGAGAAGRNVQGRAGDRGRSPDAEQAQQAEAAAIRVSAPRRRPTRTIFNIRAQHGSGVISSSGSATRMAAIWGRLLRVDPEWRNRAVRRRCRQPRRRENSADGRILLASIRAGRYTLTQTTAPTGYSTAADQSVRIAAGSVREVAVKPAAGAHREPRRRDD